MTGDVIAIPNAQHDLETLRLSGGKNVLCGVAVVGSVSADQLRSSRGGDGIEILLVILLRLAIAVRLLCAQGKAHCAGGHHGGRHSKGRGCYGRETHIGKCGLGRYSDG